jgi:arylsulfatase A-like enzyme
MRLLAALLALATVLQPSPRPSLVVLIAVDQLRPDYLPRYATQFRGGFRRILDHATLYLNGRQDHAITETAPGHSTLLSGREPAHTGIVDNSRSVADPAAPVLGSPETPGASPRRFVGTTLYDWMLARDPATRLLSVSRMDRAAILRVGRGRAPVYWFTPEGFSTSRYYADALPPWVQAFNARTRPRQFAGARWDLLLPPSAYPEPDSQPWENGGHDVVFPHRIPGDPAQAAVALYDAPVMDSLTLAFALDGVNHVGLGRGGGPDLLAISLSTTDAVGHRYGPESRELHDHLLRLDRWLGRFLDSLDRMVPAARTIVVLTADHGVQSFPERTRSIDRLPAGRIWLGDLGARLGARFDSGLLSADTAALRRRGLDPDSVAAALAVTARRMSGVRRVYTAREMTRAPDSDPDARLWRRSIPRSVGWLLCASITPGYVWSPAGRSQAQHGSTAPDDVLVPLAFLGARIPPAHIRRPARTVDIAPTLAALLDLHPAELLDGRALPEVVGGGAGQPAGK